MAVTTGTNLVYYGLSTDTKPTDHGVNGAKFVEMDTGLEYFYDKAGSQWLQFPPAAEPVE